MRRRWPLTIWIGALAALLVFVLAGMVLANAGYEMPWFTVEGGGGESAGGGYALAGTAGQADAGALAGGGYTLAGGFWPGVGPNYPRYLPIVMR